MRMPKEKLIELLKRVVRALEEDDSMEGSFGYSWVDRENYEVGAAVRVGNREGQGGMIFIAASPEDETPNPS